MSLKNNYKFNPETLEYEVCRTSVARRLFSFLFYLVLSFLVFLVFFFFYTRVLKLDTPKAMLLEREVENWHAKIAVLDERLNKNNEILNELQMRDNSLYRPIFGMEEISEDVREAGFGGVDRYSYLDDYDCSGVLSRYAKKIDIVQKKAFVQSKSYEDVSILSKRAGQMAQCIPSIPPVAPGNRLSSLFGMRLDPVKKQIYRLHAGIDISAKKGEPIYATGDGVVTKVTHDFFGYGNYVIIDHGFGYKTRYGHLSGSFVYEGQKVKRGDHIAAMGNTGRTNGTHLHYEVIYKGHPVNPLNYYNTDISIEDYRSLVKEVK